MTTAPEFVELGGFPTSIGFSTFIVTPKKSPTQFPWEKLQSDKKFCIWNRDVPELGFLILEIPYS